MNEKQGLIRKVRQALIKKELGKEYIRTEKGRKKRTDSESKTNIDWESKKTQVKERKASKD